MSLNIGESSAVVALLHFINPASEDRPSTWDAQKAALLLRDRAARALQVSGPHIISDEELADALEAIDSWVEVDQDYAADAAAEHIETIDTHGRT